MGDIQQYQTASRYRPAWASHMSELSLVMEGTDEVIPSVTYQRQKKAYSFKSYLTLYPTQQQEGFTNCNLQNIWTGIHPIIRHLKTIGIKSLSFSTLFTICLMNMSLHFTLLMHTCKEKKKALLAATNTNIKDLQCKEIHYYTAFPLRLSKGSGFTTPFLHKTDSQSFFPCLHIS